MIIVSHHFNIYFIGHDNNEETITLIMEYLESELTRLIYLNLVTNSVTLKFFNYHKNYKKMF